VVHDIYYQIAGEQTRHLITSSSSSNPYPVYSQTGHILYVDGAGDQVAIWALPFSLATLKPSGKAFPIAHQGSSPKLAGAGTLVYSDVPSGLMQLIWCDRAGKTLSSFGPARLYGFPTISPDGRKLAVHARDGAGFDVWIWELDRAVMSRLTFDSTLSFSPTWSPSGGEVTYTAFRDGSVGILSKAANGIGDSKSLVSTPRLNYGAADWSPDQKFLMYERSPGGTKRGLLYRERLKDGSLGEPAVFLQTRSNEAPEDSRPTDDS
jgi:hypothetical protein